MLSEGDKPRREFGNDYNIEDLLRPLEVPGVGPTGAGQEPLHANSGDDSSGKMEVIHRLSCRET